MNTFFTSIKVSIFILTFLMSSSSHAQRIKDLADVAGVRSNQLIGYGLVVGLPGTGEQSPFTEQSFKTMLSNFGRPLAHLHVPRGLVGVLLSTSHPVHQLIACCVMDLLVGPPHRWLCDGPPGPPTQLVP